MRNQIATHAQKGVICPLRELARKSRSKDQTSTSTSTDVKRHRTNIPTDVTLNVTSVQRSASNIQAQIDQLKQMMEELDKVNQNEKSESYPCLLFECTDKLKRGKDKETMKKINKRQYAWKSSSPEAT